MLVPNSGFYVGLLMISLCLGMLVVCCWGRRCFISLLLLVLGCRIR